MYHPTPLSRCKRRGDPQGLIRAVQNRNYAKLKRMLRHGARIDDVRLCSWKDSALHEAVRRNDLTAIAILLRARANLSVLNQANHTPLHLASSVEAVNMLVNAGADMELYDRDGCVHRTLRVSVALSRLIASSASLPWVTACSARTRRRRARSSPAAPA